MDLFPVFVATTAAPEQFFYPMGFLAARNGHLCYVPQNHVTDHAVNVTYRLPLSWINTSGQEPIFLNMSSVCVDTSMHDNEEKCFSIAPTLTLYAK